MLTSPVASVLAWQLAAGTGLSTMSMRVGPACSPSCRGRPATSRATAALADGDVDGCGRAVTAAYAIDGDRATSMMAWWRSQLPSPV